VAGQYLSDAFDRRLVFVEHGHGDAVGGEVDADRLTETSGATGKDFQFNAPLPDDQSTIIRVPLRALINGDLKYNIVIRPQDTITVQTPEAGGGEVWFDGKLVRKDGMFVVDELKGLNPENLK
jgi:hypothetical protein